MVEFNCGEKVSPILLITGRKTMDKFTYQQSPEETDAMLIYEMEEEYHREQALLAETVWSLFIEDMEKVEK